MKLNLRSICLGLIVVAVAPGWLGAWGQVGHRAVAEIAQRHLSPSAAAEVASILGGRSLASVSVWPDEIRADPSWSCSYPFHWVTVPPGSDYPRGTQAGGDVVKAMIWYSSLLRARSGPGALAPAASAAGSVGREQLRQALGFLVHFVGDVHQPLHVGLGCDRGGNDVEVEWFREPRNLHSVWDSGMIERQNLSFTELASFVDHADEGRRAEYRRASILDWLEEAQALLPRVYSCSTREDGDRCTCYQGACEDGVSVFAGCPAPTLEVSITRLPPLPRLAWEYQYRNWPQVEEQLLKAGVRLAALLDWVLGDASPPPHVAELKNLLAESDPGWSAPFEACVDRPATTTGLSRALPKE